MFREGPRGTPQWRTASIVTFLFPLDGQWCFSLLDERTDLYGRRSLQSSSCGISSAASGPPRVPTVLSPETLSAHQAVSPSFLHHRRPARSAFRPWVPGWDTARGWALPGLSLLASSTQRRVSEVHTVVSVTTSSSSWLCNAPCGTRHSPTAARGWLPPSGHREQGRCARVRACVCLVSVFTPWAMQISGTCYSYTNLKAFPGGREGARVLPGFCSGGREGPSSG